MCWFTYCESGCILGLRAQREQGLPALTEQTCSWRTCTNTGNVLSGCEFHSAALLHHRSGGDERRAQYGCSRWLGQEGLPKGADLSGSCRGVGVPHEKLVPAPCAPRQARSVPSSAALPSFRLCTWGSRRWHFQV